MAELTKKMKITSIEMEQLFDLSGNISVRYYERVGNSYEMRLRVSDTLVTEVRKTKSFKKLMEINARNSECFLKLLNNKIEQLKLEMQKLEAMKQNVK